LTAAVAEAERHVAAAKKAAADEDERRRAEGARAMLDKS